jgi:hypothetical protein
METREEYEGLPSSLRDVERALWKYWDPIGLNSPEDPSPSDEYEMYAPRILGLLYRGADDRAIAHALLAIEVDRMGFEPRPVESLLEVARQVRHDYREGLARNAT